MAGLAQFLTMLAPGAAVQAPAAYDAQLTPEANAMAGAAKPAAPKAQGFQRPKGFGKTVGTIADILAVLGGQEAGYKTAIDAQEKQFNADRKTQSLSQFLMNPTDPEATNAFIEADPNGYMGYIKEMTPKAAAVSPSGEMQLYKQMIDNGMSADEAMAQIVGFRRKNAQIVRGASDNFALTPEGPRALGTGVPQPAPAPPQITYLPGADGQYYGANGRAPGMTPMGVGVPVKGAAGASKPVPGQARNELASIVENLRKSHGELKAGGGAITASQTALGNISSSLGATGVGQAAGRALGTGNQTLRDDIASQQAGLMSALKTVTGKSSGELNSIPELALAMKQATDPSMSYEANMRALNYIEKNYLGGKQPAPAAPASGGFKVLGRRKK